MFGLLLFNTYCNSYFFFFLCWFCRSICALPNIYTDKHERFIYTNFKNPDPQEYDYIQSVRYFFMMLEYVLEINGSFDGLVVTLNSLGMNWRHITKTPMNTMKKLLDFVQVRRTNTLFFYAFLRYFLYINNTLQNISGLMITH